MKKIFTYIILVIVCSFFPWSCTLKEELTSQVSPDSFFKTAEECKAALNSSYYQMKTMYNYPLFFAVECCTDLMFCNSQTLDARMDISPSNPRCGATVWNSSYYGIKNSNCSIARIEKSPLSDEEKKPLIAEGKIMRAFYYYLLTSFFGDVPFYEEDIVTTDDLVRVTGLPRMSAVETRTKLIQELKECIEWLPAQRYVEDVKTRENRAGAAMGLMLIGKMAMWNKDWDSAIDALERLREIYGDFSQYPLSDVPSSVKDAPESIFEIQHKYVLGGINYTTAVACVCEPKRTTDTESGKTTIFDGVDIPELGGTAVTYTAARPTSYFFNSFITRTGNDKRKDMVMAWEYNGQPFSSVATRPWLGPKFWCWNMQSDYDGNNYKLFRYADAILMLAESYNEVGRGEEAIEELNKIKTRAGIKLFPKSKRGKKDAILEEIQMERGRELFGEFHRKFDLVRWGIWYFQTSNYNDLTYVKQNIRPFHEYYPIPDTEIKLSGNALDNNAYLGGNN